MDELIESLGITEQIEEQATGCAGVGAYRQYAASMGYPIVKVLDWTSSAGDWSFLVSRDGHMWQVLSQENNYPRGPGFSYFISDEVWLGTFEEVCELIESLMT